MADGLVATNLDEAEALEQRLRSLAGVAAGSGGHGLAQCDPVLGPLAIVVPEVTTSTAAWREDCHDVLASLALAVRMASTRTARADQR